MHFKGFHRVEWPKMTESQSGATGGGWDREPRGLALWRGPGAAVRRCGRWQHDPNRPEDVLKVDADEDGVGGDDAADCLRYLVAAKARSVIARKLRGV